MGKSAQQTCTRWHDCLPFRWEPSLPRFEITDRRISGGDLTIIPFTNNLIAAGVYSAYALITPDGDTMANPYWSAAVPALLMIMYRAVVYPEAQENPGSRTLP